MCKCINLERLQLSMKGIYRDARNDFGVVARPAVSANRNPRFARLAYPELQSLGPRIVETIYLKQEASS